METKVNYKSCNDKHAHQIEINTDMIVRITRVETKIDMGFKQIAEQIKNGGK